MLYIIAIIGHNGTNPRIKYSTETKSSSFFSPAKCFLPCGWRATFMEISDIYLDFNVFKHLMTVGWNETVGAVARSGRWDIAQQRLGFVYQNQSNRSNRLQKPRLFMLMPLTWVCYNNKQFWDRGRRERRCRWTFPAAAKDQLYY